MANFPFQSLKTKIDYTKGHVVEWALSAAFNGKAPYNFTLEISEDPTFTVLLKTINVGENFYAVDDTKLQQSFALVRESYRYRVRLDTADNQTIYSQPMHFSGNSTERHKYLTAAEMLRKEWVRLQYVGRNGWVLKRKNYGAVAVEDVSPISGIPITDNRNSFGTGFEGGYYSPVKFRYSHEKWEQKTKLDEQGLGINYNEQVAIRTTSFPSIEPYDVIITDNNERMLVADSQAVYFPGSDITLIQNCTCRMIANTDAVYNITTPVD
jgi:hypothetical protein